MIHRDSEPMEPGKRRPINPEKLLLSKWTAVTPRKLEKHFIVSEVIRPSGDEGPVEFVVLEAVLTRRLYTLPWKVLQDKRLWLQGWR